MQSGTSEHTGESLSLEGEARQAHLCSVIACRRLGAAEATEHHRSVSFLLLTARKQRAKNVLLGLPPHACRQGFRVVPHRSLFCVFRM